jgi:serine protease Do
MSTANGWYAVVAGPENVPSPDEFKSKLLQSYFFPKDTLLSKGESFIQQIWQPPASPILAHASLDGKLPTHANVASIQVALEARSDRIVAIVRFAHLVEGIG